MPGAERQGPLTGLKIIEFAGIGPVPYACMVLADLGAAILRIDRPGGYPAVDATLDFAAMEAASVFNRSRALLRIDLKSQAGRALALRLIGQADALMEGYRPGTMERIGLGPEPCLRANPKLAYVRVTGWGQQGPMAKMAGHDLNYIGLSGALSLFARDGAPPPAIPPLIGDMAGGGLFAVIGLLSAVMAARAGGPGQVVDAAMLDGSANLYAMLSALVAMGAHDPQAGGNVLDGGRHYYRSYACACGGHIAVGAIEPAFRRALLEGLSLGDDPLFSEDDPAREPARIARLADILATRSRDDWAAQFAGTDACVTPILRLDEVGGASHNAARGLFETLDDVSQPAPAPRFSATPGAISRTPRNASRADAQALLNWGVPREEIAALAAQGVIEA